MQRLFAMEDLVLAKLLTKARLQLEMALGLSLMVHQQHQHGNRSNLVLFPKSLQGRCCTSCCTCTLRCECNLDKMVYLPMKQTDCADTIQRNLSV